MQAAGPVFPFRTGQAAGYIEPVGPLGTVVAVPFDMGGPVYAQLRAWEAAAGPTYEQAAVAGGKYGFSNFVFVEPGVAPGPPAQLLGLQSFCLVPEPSPLALLIGAFVVLGPCIAIRAKWKRGELPSERV